MGAAAIVHHKERQLVEVFRHAGALSPETARDLDWLRVDPDAIGFRRLHRLAAVREAAPGTYYLDEEVWTAVRATRRRLVFVMLLIVVLVAIIIVVTSSGVGSGQR
jgi:hypothetical protein